MKGRALSAPERASAVGWRPGAAASAALAMLVLVLVAAGVRAQHLEGPPTEQLRVEWTAEVSRALGPVVTGSVYNYTTTSVRHVQLRIEVQDASGRMVAEVYRFVMGDIAPGSRAYFVAPVRIAGAGYRVTIRSFEVLGGAP